MWDSYGDWDDIANMSSVEDVKAKITGNKLAWRPNFCPPSLAYAFDYACSEYEKTASKPTSVLDFGCGLGRNAPLLKSFFDKVIGIDRSDMIKRLQLTYPDLTNTCYDALYDSIDELVANDEICVLYDSVVFQHLMEETYILRLLDTLGKFSSLRTFISLHNFRDHVRPPHIHLMQDLGWSIWHTETETLSFEGALHSLVFLRKW
jgi:trans-aconitate methyltransferase